MADSAPKGDVAQMYQELLKIAEFNSIVADALKNIRSVPVGEKDRELFERLLRQHARRDGNQQK